MKKITALFILVSIFAFCFIGCSEEPTPPSDENTNQGTNNTDTPNDKLPPVAIFVSSFDVNVGDKITVTVKFNSIKAVKTYALRPIFDEEIFEIVSGRMLVTGSLSNFSNGIGVQAFDELIDLENANVMQFVLKAKGASNSEAIGCEISIKGENDNVIVVSQPDDINVTVR